MKKYTIEMNDEMDELVAALAAARGLHKSQVIRRAIGLLEYLDQLSASHDIVLRPKDDPGQEQRLLMESEIMRGRS